MQVNRNEYGWVELYDPTGWIAERFERDAQTFRDVALTGRLLEDVDGAAQDAALAAVIASQTRAGGGINLDDLGSRGLDYMVASLIEIVRGAVSERRWADAESALDALTIVDSLRADEAA